MRTRRSNHEGDGSGRAPFPVGRPVGPDDIVDRHAFIHELATRLRDRHSVMLAAPRRTGKTSLALETLRRLRQQGAFTVMVDLSHAASVDEFAEALVQACLANVTPIERLASAGSRGVARLLRQPEVRVKLHEYEISLRFGPSSTATEATRFLDAALQLPERMAAKDNRLCVVLLDEFQHARALGGLPLLRRMRAIFQLQEHTVQLFLGSQAGMLAQMFGAEREPFFRFATPLELPPVPDSDWYEYLARRFHNRSLSVDDRALDALVGYTGGHPHDTMLVAYEAYVLAADGGRVTRPVVLAGCEAAQERLAPLFELEADALGSHARTVLRRIAQGEAVYGRAPSKAAVSSALKHLVRSGVVRKTGRGRYELTETMLARHLRET